MSRLLFLAACLWAFYSDREWHWRHHLDRTFSSWVLKLAQLMTFILVRTFRSGPFLIKALHIAIFISIAGLNLSKMGQLLILTSYLT